MIRTAGLLTVAGLVLVVAGVAMWSASAAFILSGAAVLWAAHSIADEAAP